MQRKLQATPYEQALWDSGKEKLPFIRKEIPGSWVMVSRLRRLWTAGGWGENEKKKEKRKKEKRAQGDRTKDRVRKRV